MENFLINFYLILSKLAAQSKSAYTFDMMKIDISQMLRTVTALI